MTFERNYMAPKALLSVSDKTGIIPFAKALCQVHGFELISSGGTAKAIEDAGLPVTRVADYTDSPEILGGRVKTIHPRIHGGILAKREDQTHTDDLEKANIHPIDLVVVNLYPFSETVANPKVQWDKAIENIDIGGPAMVRAAAKNHAFVTILTRPEQYERFLKAIENGLDNLTYLFRQQLALEAFEHTASYDIAISQWMAKNIQPKSSPWLQALPLKQVLRYGENPHQKASWFSISDQGWGAAIQVQGKDLSTNNLIDLEAALLTVQEFGYDDSEGDSSIKPAAVVVKHTNPCGVATNEDLSVALHQALNADSVSSFGGIVALNKRVDKNSAIELKKLFLECVVSPGFSAEALEILSEKTNLRLLKISSTALNNREQKHIRSILGGLLIQDQDNEVINSTSWKLVTRREPNIKEQKDLIFAWKLVKHVHSNAIVVASSGRSLGIGAGQMNRVGSAKIALEAAGKEAKNAVLASDGFLPFSDTVRLANSYGITAIVQPGGSIRDKESINACDELGLAMLLTGRRHFLH